MVGCIDHFTDREAVTRAKAEHPAALVSPQPFQTLHMGIDQIHDMHIVTDTGAIRRRVIRAVNGKRVPTTVYCVKNEGEEMSFRAMKFAHFRLGIRACDIEIEEDNVLQAMRGLEINQNSFDRA